jgi:hypothetical protein
MYSKFVDHLAVALAMYQRNDSAGASKAIQAAFKSPDADKSMSMLLARNERAFKASADDVGVDFEVPGDELRLEPEQEVMASDDGDADDMAMPEEELEAPITASLRRLKASAAKERSAKQVASKAAASKKPAVKQTASLKDRYFAAIKG